MIVSPRVTLAVLVTLSVVTDILVSSSTLRRGRQNRRRVHKQRKRPRFGRQDDLITTTSAPLISPVPAPGVERYDLTSYGQGQVGTAPAIAYGAPGPEDDITDGYSGDLPGASVQVIGGQETEQDYDNGVPGAASDSGDEEREESSEARTDDIPPWCNPTDPMGAWLNHQKIQASRKFDL